MNTTLPTGARFVTTDSGSPLLEISTKTWQGCISMQGGQLVSFFSKDNGLPLIYLSPLARIEAQRPIRGGIPVCWPWFGPHPSESEAPRHGIARLSLWQLDSVWTEGETFHVKLSGPKYQSLCAQLEYVLGPNQVSTLLTSYNKGQTAQTVSAAIHSYLAVGKIEQVSIHGIEGLQGFDQITQQRTTLPNAPLQLSQETDLIVQSANEVSVQDPMWDRQIQVSGQGSASCVIWNPWKEKSRSLNDLPNDGWQDFICVETANADRDIRHLLPGEKHTLAQKLFVSSLANSL